MNLKDIANIRLNSQHIAQSKFKTAKDLVGWMGAMQAQDYAMAKWALGTRLAVSTDKIITTAIDKGEIIRTHVLRPTWHLVSPGDIYWMLQLTAARIKASMNSVNKNLELTEAIFKKSNSLIEKSLTGGKHLTREELMAILEKSKIRTDSLRSAHLMLRAELDGIACSGTTAGNKQTYTLLAERIPETKSFTRDKALALLAKKYFSSHGPATLQDFTWWSGLSFAEARDALEMVKSYFIKETIGNETYWFNSSSGTINNNNSSVYLLPAFDEFIISYKDRSASVSSENQKKSFTTNGIFKPVIVINGEVTGLWKRTIKNDKVIIETEFFKPHSKAAKALIKKTAATFGDFINKKAEVSYGEQ